MELIRHALPTRNNIRKRGIDINGDCVCQQDEESCDHLFRICDLIKLYGHTLIFIVLPYPLWSISC